MSEVGHAYIKRFGVACFLLHSTNHYHQSVLRILIILRIQNHPVALWEGDLNVTLKVYEEPLGYVEGSSLTLRNYFIQPYRALDTLFPNIINYS